MEPKNLNISDSYGAKKNIDDLKIFGDPDSWQLICKASSQSQGWMKSTKAMDVGVGVLVQVTTQQRNPDESYAIAESLCFVPGVIIETASDGLGRKIVPKPINRQAVMDEVDQWDGN